MAFKGEVYNRIRFPFAYGLVLRSVAFISFRKKYPVTKVASTSAMGKDIQTPSSLKYSGRIIMSGIKKKPCRVKVKSSAGTALPMA